MLFPIAWVLLLTSSALAADDEKDKENDEDAETESSEDEEGEDEKKDDDLDDEDLFDDNDEDLLIAPAERLKEADQLQTIGAKEGSDEAIEAFRDSEEEIDILSGDGEAEVPTGPGTDTAESYRAAQVANARLAPDEEVEAWDKYLEKYPNSAFKKRIQDRIDSLMEGLYGPDKPAEVAVDAMNQELEFAQVLLLENIDPRTRLQAGFQWGFPDFFDLAVDYEHAFSRNFSVHGGIKHRYTGWSVEPGVRWALVKSTRTKTIVTLIGDTHLNTNPVFFGLRPQLAAGRQFGKLDAQIQGGVDLELGSIVGYRVVGGASATYNATDTVAMFVETQLNMKNFDWEGGVFTFDTLSFGMKFYPGKKGRDEVNVGATLPYATRYWQYHYGALMGQVNHYFD